VSPTTAGGCNTDAEIVFDLRCKVNDSVWDIRDWVEIFVLLLHLGMEIIDDGCGLKEKRGIQDVYPAHTPLKIGFTNHFIISRSEISHHLFQFIRN
jgi:hypothetical protein